MFVRRASALAIDVAAIYTIEFVVGLPAAVLLGVTPAALEEAMRWPLIATYFIAFWRVGATPGMRVMRLSLTASDGRAPGVVPSAIRFAVLGGVVALSGATLLIWLVPYVVICLFGLYPHDTAARTRMTRSSGQLDERTPEVRASKLIIALLRAFAILMFAGLAIGIAFGGIGDAGYSAWVRNDGDATLRILYAFDNGAAYPARELAAGAVTSLSKVGGPREQPRVRISGYDVGGSLVYCRDLQYSEYRNTSSSMPLSAKLGEVSCR